MWTQRIFKKKSGNKRTGEKKKYQSLTKDKPI